MESISAERVNDERLHPFFLPIHVRSRKMVDAHEDVHCDEQPQLICTRRSRTISIPVMSIGCGVCCDRMDRVLCQHALEEVHLSDGVMDGQLWSRGNR